MSWEWFLKISKNKNISFFGIGGEEMSKVQNFKSLFDIGDISVMGIFEILKRIFIIKKRIKQTRNITWVYIKITINHLKYH